MAEVAFERVYYGVVAVANHAITVIGTAQVDRLVIVLTYVGGVSEAKSGVADLAEGRTNKASAVF